MTLKEEQQKREDKEYYEKRYAECVEGDWVWQEKMYKEKMKLERKEACRGKGLINSRMKTVSYLKNLIACNAWRWPKKNGQMFPPIFLTLTFEEEITNLKRANRIFSKFIQRYNYSLYKTKDKVLQYIAVPEFQQNGRVHYHCLFFNLPYNPKNYDIAREAWGNGFILMKATSGKTIYGLSNYLSKYLVKEFDDSRLYKKRKYFPSANLFRPIIIKGYWKSASLLEVLQKTRSPEKIKKSKVIYDFVGPIESYRCQLEPNESLSDFLSMLDPYTKSVLQSELDREQGKLNI
ncbi:MAG: hypothetical protein WC427_00360 [Candidatus Paceibacterota bacterium]